MKRFYAFLMLLVASVVGTFSAQAADYYEAVGFTTGGQLTEITPGQEVVLQTASTTRPDFMMGLTKAHSVVPEAIYVFEEAGTDATSGQMTYILKQKFTGLYLGDGKMTDAKSQAYVFRANLLKPENWYKVNEKPEGTDPFTTALYNDANYGGAPAEKAWVFCKATSKADDYQYIATFWYNGAVSFWSYQDTNTWQIFAVAPLAGYAKLQAAMTTLFPEGITVDGVFTKGNQVGQVPAEYYDALVAVYTEAMDLYNAGLESADPTRCGQVADQLSDAFKACEANLVKLGEGYVLIRVNPAKYPNGFWYAAGNELKWTPGTTWQKPETFTVNDAKYIWKVTRDANVENGFKFQNFQTGTYPGAKSKQSETLNLVADNSQTFIVEPSPIKGLFNIKPTQNKNWSAHAAAAANGVVYWSLSSEASSWTFEYVDASIIESLQGQVDKLNLGVKLNNLADQAKRYMASTYSFDKGDELLVDVSQIWSNAKEVNEGSYEALLDNNTTTFFHSSWSNPGVAPIHNLVVDVATPTKDLVFSYVKRTENLSRAPLNAVLYATNEIAPGDSLGGASWKKVDDLIFTYPDTATVNGTVKENWRGGVLVKLPEAYRYFRLDMVNNSSGSKYFTFAEFHAQTISIKENSPINSVPANLITELEAAIANAKAAVADTTATQEHIDQLQAAYDAFVAAVPNPVPLIALLSTAKRFAAAMEESDQLGYFATGSQAAVLAKLAELEPQITPDLRSVETIKNLTAQVEAAIQDIHNSLNKPLNGHFYRLKAKGTASADNVLWALGNGAEKIAWKGSKDNSEFTNCLEYIWKAIANEDGTYSFQNALYGNYLGANNSGNNSEAILSSETPVAIPLEFPGTIGLFNFAQGKGKFANTDPSGVLVIWASRDANSLFAIEEVMGDFQGYEHVAVKTAEPLFMTFPVEILSAEGAKLYEVIGIKDGATLELAAVDGVPAGRPFVAVNESADAGFYLVLNGTTPDEINAAGYVTAPTSHNGLVGVLAADTIQANQGILAKGTIIKSGSDEVIDANTAWINFSEVPVATVAGDYSIALDESLVTGISSAVVRTANTAIFDLQGRKIAKPTKGIFIVNGKKVLVK